MLFCRLIPTKRHLFDPANSDFVDGAVWYLGEVMRRAKGGDWHYRPGPPDPWNPYVGRYYVQQPGEKGRTKVPILDFEYMLGPRYGPCRASLTPATLPSGTQSSRSSSTSP